MRLFLIFMTVVFWAGVTSPVTQSKDVPRPHTLELSGACFPEELSVEYFITGQFGGYSSFISMERWYSRYEIPTVRNGFPAKTLKLMIRGARCRTMIFDFPELSEEGQTIKARLKRTRSLEFRGRINSLSAIAEKDAWLTVEYWAHWKCEFMGVPDCLIGPNRVEAVDVRSDGRFKVRLPDIANDPALSAFADKGSFQFFIREKKTGNVLYNLSSPARPKVSLAIPVATDYPHEIDFVIESNP